MRAARSCIEPFPAFAIEVRLTALRSVRAEPADDDSFCARHAVLE
eukprot:COSAG02_NODE_62756_length_265_cov_0.608434_1_plen_44_part_10